MARKQDALCGILEDNALVLDICFDGTTGQSRWVGTIIFEDSNGEEVIIESSTLRLDSIVTSLIEQLETKGYTSNE